MKKVAIQGIAGSFHDLAVRRFFGREMPLCPCSAFPDLPREVLSGRSDYAVMAIENTLAGAILPNYRLIDENGLFITGEIYIPVRHAVMGLPGQSLEQIREVYSHPMALAQCLRFFNKYPLLKRIEYEDTAQAARMIATTGRKKAAAIAPALAAELYGLEIWQDGIQDHPTNTTRFVILQKHENSPPEQGKISMKIVLEHRAGSLYELLGIFAEAKINMTKLQSVPIPEKPWEYAFFIDALFDDRKVLEQLLIHIRKETKELKILGIYPTGKK
jgi:prephenate dehydratase